MKQMIWLSYDLEVRGDYEGLYRWLDDHEAQECGDNVAVLTYEFSGSLTDSLSDDLRKAIKVTDRTRVYVIRKDRETGKVRGGFVIGGRKAPPWSGYAARNQAADVDET